MSSLSLIIPIRNRFPLVKRTLASVASQSRKPDRLIIVDNGSNPPVAVALAQELETLRALMPVSIIVCNEEGAPAARNAGLDAADTEWTMFFDSDDIMSASHIANAMAAAESNADADIIGWDAAITDESGQTLRRKNFPSERYLYNAIMHGSLATQCYMARTTLFRNAGGWNLEAKIWNDMELSVRLLLCISSESGFTPRRIIKTPDKAATVSILAHSDSITGSNFSDRAAERDHTLDIIVSYSPTKEITPVLALKRMILAACCRREGNSRIARELYEKSLQEPLSLIHRCALIFAYHYTSMSLPGAARLLMWLFS